MNQIKIDNATSDFIISKATINDANDIISFLNAVGGETDFLTFGLNEFPFSVQNEIDIINECNEQNECSMLLGKINNEIVSHLFLDRSSLKRIHHIGTIGVTVGKKHWRKSIGKNMILFAMDWAKSQKITKLQLSVRTDNISAIELYKKLGFYIECTLSKAVKIEDCYFDNYLMELDL